MKTQRCKGMRDLTPVQMRKFRYLEGIFRDLCLKSGYSEVKTPTLEYLHLFTSAGTLTPGMLGRVYSFLDWDGWSGERVVMRPDATIPVARLYIENFPDNGLVRFFYFTPVFIFEETGRKTRERWQGGVELIGVSSTLADIELISLAMDILHKLGLNDVELRLSHAGITRRLLNEITPEKEEQHLLFDRILDGDQSVLSQLRKEKPDIASLLNLQESSPHFQKKLACALDSLRAQEQKEGFLKISNTLKKLGFKFKVGLASVRGFEYYTGIIFQLYYSGKKIGGGGRYDCLIPSMGGKETPASGFALYIDHLINIVQENNMEKPLKVVVNPSHGAINIGFETCRALREAGYTAELYLGGVAEDGSWHLDIQTKQPYYLLTHPSKNKRYELGTINEVVGLLNRSRL